MNNYQEFLQRKAVVFKSSGFQVDKSDLNSACFDFQRDLVVYALRKGRAGIYADTGLGKSVMLSEWARLANEETRKNVLVISPLGVAKQTINLVGDLLGNEIVYSRHGKYKAPVTITNYENAKKFNPDDYGALVCDESSIFKGEASKYKQAIFDMFRGTPYKLFCSATPSPNDSVEIINQAEGLGIMDERSVKANFFVHDKNHYRLKGHSEQKFYRWLASWGMHLTKPSDLGYNDDGFILPKLNIIPTYVKSGFTTGNQLFFTGLKGITDRSRMRQATHKMKCERAAEIVNSSNDQFIVWCGLNKESELAAKLINDSVEVAGRHSLDYKEKAFEDFVAGKFKVLVTKGSIAGFGMNFQHSWNSCFIGLNDSFEGFYQYIRRQYRFGQQNDVNAYIILADVEKEIYDNVLRKQRLHEQTVGELIKNISEYEKEEIAGMFIDKSYNPNVNFKLPLFLNGRK